jgi:hypothetical protein
LGCGGFMLKLLLVLIVLAIVMALVQSFGSSSGSGGSGSPAQISQVTHTHQKLAKSECDESDEWIDDRADWLDDEPEVVSAMRYFYKKTGSQPYLVIANDVDGKTDFTDAEAEEWVNDIYDEQFSDDGHTVVAFVEYSESEYAYYIVAGRSAQSVIDEEAREIIADEINYWYTDTSLDDNEYFAKVFTESADAIMFDYEETTKTSNSKARMIVLGLTAAGAAVIIGIVVSRTSKRKKEEYEAARKLAETPVSSSTTGTASSTDASGSSSADDVPSVASELEEFEKKYGTD